MNELVAELLSVVRAMWRRRWFGVAGAWVVACLGAFALWEIPDRYEASARVYVDTKTVLRPLLRDLTVEPEIDQTISMLARTMLTRPNVDRLMQATFRDSESMGPAERAARVESLMKEIRISGAGRENIFDFKYFDTDPDQAKRLVTNLVSTFVQAGTNNKQRDAESAREFIDEQIKINEARLAEAENRLKEFKLKNMGVVDGPGRDYFARISALSEELNKLTLDLRAAEQSRDALKRELEGEVATLVPEMVSQELPILTPEIDARLDTQRKQLDELLRRYTDLHPDVVATRRLITRLEEQRDQLRQEEVKRRAALPKQGNRGFAAGETAQRVRLALAEAEANLASLRVRVADTQSRLAQMRAAANRVPQVEAELTQLNRDYDIIRRNYEALVARREKAVLSEDVDASRTAQFRVIEPPRASPKPVFPNRMAMVPLILIVSLAAGAAVSFLVAQIVPTIDESRTLRVLSKRPVLGSISRLRDEMSAAAALRSNLAFGSAFGSLVVVFGTWLAWIALTARG